LEPFEKIGENVFATEVRKSAQNELHRVKKVHMTIKSIAHNEEDESEGMLDKPKPGI